MAPVRKKSVNKRFLGEVSPVKEVKNSTMARKQKSSKLGPPWTTKELRRFYKAYRRHGKSWKKVAAEVRNRSVEMVEALYNLNRAYLSLPEGTASVDGLVAMMIDHYDALDEVELESEGEGDGSPEPVQRPKKQKLDRIERSTLKAGLNHFRPSASTDGCFSLMKKASLSGGQPRAVGKRTPRVPVNRVDDVNSGSIKEKGQQSDMDDHVAAFALTEASNRGCSPRGSQMLPRKDKLSKDGFGSKDVNTDINAYPKATTSCGFEGVGTVGFRHKGKMFYGRKVGSKENGSNLSDNENEACKRTDVKRRTTLLGSATPEVSSSKSNKSSRGGKRKRCKELSFGDEFLDLDALQMLADLSARESESNCELKEERVSVDRNDKSDIPEATPCGHEEEVPVEVERLSSLQKVQGCFTRKQKFGRNSANFKPSPEQSIHFNSSERMMKDVASEVSNEGEIQSSVNVEQSDLSRQSKPTLAMDGALTAEQMKISSCINGSTEPLSVSNQVILSTGKRSSIKADLKRAVMHKEGRSSKKIIENEFDNQLNPLNDRELDLAEKLSCCLSSPMVRRWCSYEWFYNAIDYPWFANEEFVEYLNHVGLGHIPRLTRVEWGVIRSSLGKPRRFSHCFLHEEREKLKKYRESVRTHYAELRSGARDGLPMDLAKPLSVGQRVTAFHPKRRELCDGMVLAVECGKCRLQFDCQLEVEFIEDVDCMPLNPMDNMPEALRTQRLQVREHSMSSLASSWQQEDRPSPLRTLVSQPKVDELHSVPQTKAAGPNVVTTQHGSSCQNIVTQVSTEEADRKTISGLTSLYDVQASSVPPSSWQYSLHPGSIWHPWLKTDSSSTCVRGTPSYSNSPSHFHESESVANDIIRTSRLKAGAMVDAAIHAFSLGDKGEAPYWRTKKALDSVDSSTSQAEPRIPFIESADDVNGSSYSHNHLSHDTSEPKVNADRLEESHNGLDRMDALIPSELIKSCVASLQTIQTCSETRYPHADVAQAIESALASLHPCCPQNLSLYRDIQTRMGIIKRQIFSMVRA